MHTFRADLHIHTVLSPCADLEMTPKKIVESARKAGLDIVGITDHNSTKNAVVVKKYAESFGLYVLMGAEVTTKEEVHCLTFFEEEQKLIAFQKYLDANIIRIPNREGHFGYQPVIDADENVLEMIPYFLPAALKTGISEVQQKVYELDGIFIPAHVTRPMNGLFAQLGFIPPGLKFDALGITAKSTAASIRKEYGLGKNISLVYNSDAHFPEQIGRNYTVFHLKEKSFSEIRMALHKKQKRSLEDR
jgi:hypothetical protein